jgi:hypothetical protein
MAMKMGNEVENSDFGYSGGRMTSEIGKGVE